MGFSPRVYCVTIVVPIADGLTVRSAWLWMKEAGWSRVSRNYGPAGLAGPASTRHQNTRTPD